MSCCEDMLCEEMFCEGILYRVVLRTSLLYLHTGYFSIYTYIPFLFICTLVATQNRSIPRNDIKALWKVLFRARTYTGYFVLTWHVFAYGKKKLSNQCLYTLLYLILHTSGHSGSFLRTAKDKRAPLMTTARYRVYLPPGPHPTTMHT